MSDKDLEKKILEYKENADKGNIEVMYIYGWMLYNGKGIEINKEEAARYFKMAADGGNIEAMHNYGWMLYNGKDIEINKEEAARYYKMAADGGQIDAMYNYAYMLDEGDGIEVNKTEAARYYKMAADKGHTEAMFNYASMLYNGKGIEINKKEAARYFSMAANKGYVDAMYNYGVILYNGYGIVTNKEEAARYFKMAADEGQIDAMYNYGCMLYEGEGIKVNKKEAARYYKLAVDKGHTEAMFNYALMLDNGEGIKINKEEAAKYFKMAVDNGNIEARKLLKNCYRYEADNGNIDAMYNYGVMLENEEEDLDGELEAANYYKIAADNGHIGAMYNYGIMLNEGKGIWMDKKEAARYFKMAADKGHIDAMYNYATMLKNGEEVKMDKKEAARYFKMAADKGHIDAMYSCGVMLNKGIGILMNKEEAARYFSMAANKGYANAMYSYGVMLYNGEGVIMNKEEAAKYFYMAANKGYADAMYIYGWMLENGEGVKMNKKRAIRYYKMAAKKGYVRAQILLANIGKIPTEVERLEIENNTINTVEIDFINESYLINFLNSKGYKNPTILGRGGFSEVYEMEKDGESYAVKIPNIYKEDAKIPIQLKRDEELQMLIDLSGGGHTKKIDGFNIKQKGREKVYQIEIFKLRKKDNLSKILKSTNNNMPDIHKFSLISQLAVAYKKLHSNGIVHKDIKPENVLFNIGDKRVKTADYGLSKIGKSHDRSGTIRYMAPEVMNFEDKNIYVNEKSDVYSMGIMFLKILTGKTDIDLLEPTYIEENETNQNRLFKYLSSVRNNKEIDYNELGKLIYKILLQDLFLSKKVDKNSIRKIQEELVELISGMLEKNPEMRLSSNQVAEKCGEIFKICNLSKAELETLGIYDKDLYALGIFNEDTLEYQKNKIKRDLELLQRKKLADQNNQNHLDTLTGKKELSTECKNYLGILLEYFNREDEINLNLDNDEFKENMKRINKPGNQREYLLIINKILDIKELKMSNEIFRLEEMGGGIEEERQIKEKKEELEKLKEERGLIILKHIELSRLSNSSEKRSNDKKAKKKLKNLVKVSNELTPLKEKGGMKKS